MTGAVFAAAEAVIGKIEGLFKEELRVDLSAEYQSPWMPREYKTYKLRKLLLR